MVSLPLSLSDSITRTISGCAPRRPLGRHPAQSLTIPLLLIAAVLRAPGDPIAGAALVGTSAALLVLKWPTDGMNSWRLEAGLGGHFALALLVSGWHTMEFATAGVALGLPAARVMLALIGASAVLFSLLELVGRQHRFRRFSPEAIGPLQPFLSQVAETLEALVSALSHTPKDFDASQRASRRARAYRHHLSNLGVVSKSRPLADGLGPVVQTLWELLDPATMPFPVEHVRVHRDIGPGEMMAGVPAPYLELLFWNLADNAFRASSERAEGSVSVSATLTERGIEVTFSDDGPGIPEGERARAFTPLRYAQGGRLHLGLSASQKIAETYGGSLELSTRPGGGTRVVVVLPPAKQQ